MTSTSRTVIEIDPTGDVLLTLNNPGAPFAVWDLGDGNRDSEGSPQLDEENELTRDESEAAGRKRKAMSTDQLLERQSKRERTSSTPEQTDCQPLEPPRAPARVYRVSSRHLINASAIFRSQLTGPSAASLLCEHGNYHLSTTDWDADAFSMLLNMFHLRYRQIPKRLELEMFAKMAVLVDHYNCWEAFDLIVPIWVRASRKTSWADADYGRNTMLWMIISWVFKLPEEFRKATAAAIRHNQEANVRDMKLGIPEVILGTKLVLL